MQPADVGGRCGSRCLGGKKENERSETRWGRGDEEGRGRLHGGKDRGEVAKPCLQTYCRMLARQKGSRLKGSFKVRQKIGRSPTENHIPECIFLQPGRTRFVALAGERVHLATRAFNPTRIASAVSCFFREESQFGVANGINDSSEGKPDKYNYLEILLESGWWINGCVWFVGGKHLLRENLGLWGFDYYLL